MGEGDSTSEMLLVKSLASARYCVKKGIWEEQKNKKYGPLGYNYE
jgi:hypothetical protein